MTTMTPFVKWAGGKRQLVEVLLSKMPTQYGTYFEPFIGGGALLIALKPKKAIISDLNDELISAYRTIQNDVTSLIEILKKHERLHKEDPLNYYYQIRDLDRQSEWGKSSELEKAGRFIYLNKSCFNGLYRVNSKGFFNVPFNKKENVVLFDETNLILLSDFLSDNDISILNKDFISVTENAKKGDFIYFDPPYDLIKKDTFDSYNKNAFGVEGQIRLANEFKRLSELGCYVMLSNHNTDLIRQLYAAFNIEVIQVKRMINSDSSKRTGEEVIITNFKNDI